MTSAQSQALFHDHWLGTPRRHEGHFTVQHSAYKRTSFASLPEPRGLHEAARYFDNAQSLWAAYTLVFQECQPLFPMAGRRI